MYNAAKAYRETQVTTTSPGQVLLMLYDGALNYLSRAKERIDANDPAGKGILISKALDVINELASSLNAEKGGKLAGNLNELYFYCNKRLFMANLKMDKAMIDEVMKILGGLRSAYSQILDMPEAVAAAKEVEMNRKAAPQQAAVPMKGGGAAAPMPLAAKQARMRGAYGQQSAESAPHDTAVETAVRDEAPAVTPAPSAFSVPSGPSVPCAVPAAPVTAQNAAHDDASLVAKEEKPVPVLEAGFDPPLPVPGAESPPPGLLGANRRLAASALYRKFSS